MDWLSKIFDYFADSTRLAWLSITITIIVAIISVKLTNRFARKLSVAHADALTNDHETCDRLLDDARKLMGAVRLRGPSKFGNVTGEKLEQGLILILQATAKCPRYARAHYEYGVYELRSQRPHRAIAHFKNSVRLERKNARYHCSLGQAYWESARSIYLNDGVVMIQHLFSRPFSVLKIVSYRFLGRRCFKKALKLDPELYIAHIRMGVGLVHRHKDKAQAHFEKALQLEPNNPGPYLNLIHLFFDHGDFAMARVIAKQGLKRHPDDLLIVKFLKKIYAAENNFEKLKELEDLHPAHGDRTDSNLREPPPAAAAFRLTDTRRVHEIGSHPIVRNLRQYDKAVNSAVEHLLSENMEDARDEFENLANRYPHEPMYKLALADCALDNADYDQATTLLNAATPIVETDWYWRYICFSIFYRQQDYDKASELAENWWNADNRDTQALSMYCNALLASGDISTVAEVLDKAVVYPELENHALLTIAELYISADKPEQADKLLQRVLASEPQNFKVHLGLCSLYQHMKDYARLSDYAHSAQTLGADQSQCLFYRAVSCANLDDTDEAIKLLTECINLNADKPSYHLHLGYAYAERLDYQRAENAFHTAHNLAPNWSEPFHALGELYVEMRSTTDAIKVYEQLLEISPRDALGHFRLAYCCSQDGQRDRAIEHYQRAIELGDEHHVTYFNLGLLHERESPQLAREYYEKALAIAPTYAPALFNIGIQYMHRNRHLESLPCFESAQEHDPDNTAYSERLAMAYHDAGRYESCIQLANDIITHDPENFIAWDCLGQSLAAQNNTEAALSAFTQASELSSVRRVEFLNRIGNLYLDSGDHDAALKCYTEIIKSYPDNAVAYMNTGNIHFNRGDTEVAMRWYNRAGEKDPEYAVPYYNRASIYNKREQYDLALEQLDTAIDLDHQYTAALIFKGAILMDDKHDLKLAQTTFERCLEISPFNIYALTRLAQLHNQLQHHEQALSYANQAIKIDADNTNAREQLTIAKDALGRNDDARGKANLHQEQEVIKDHINE